MDFFLDLLQGAGIAAAIGIRPFLPVLLVGALARRRPRHRLRRHRLRLPRAGAGSLAVVLVMLALATSPSAAPGRRRSSAPAYAGLRGDRRSSLGALEGAASLADHGHAVGAGVVVGRRLRGARLRRGARAVRPACAARLDAEAAGALPVYAEGAALAPPCCPTLVPAACAARDRGPRVLLVGGRRRSGEKYAGPAHPAMSGGPRSSSSPSSTP